MKNITKMSSEERKSEFVMYLKKHDVNSAQRYINDLERGYLEAPIKKYKSIFDITSPDLLENPYETKALRASSVFTRKSKGGTAGLAGLNWYIRFLKDSRDSYYDFMDYFKIKPKQLFDWGMRAIIFPPIEEVESQWERLKYRIFNNEVVHIRGYGRDAHGTQLFVDFYKYIFKNEHVIKDGTNNYWPQANIKKMTGLCRNEDIYNYQVSHIWGRTKNVFLFEAPWNICYTPKIIDPLTGHETKGDLPVAFQEYFQKEAYKKYKKIISDYNNIIASYDFENLLDEFCRINEIKDANFVSNAIVELSPIKEDGF